MIITTIIALIPTLLKDLVIYLIGRILNNPIELREFLGLGVDGEELARFSRITEMVGKIGKVVMIIAAISAFSSIVTTITVLASF